MEQRTGLNVTALVRLLRHVENVAETRLSGTAGTEPGTATAASWLTLINASLRAAVLETERAALDALNAGGLLASLRQYMPDAAELAALLDFSAEAAEDMRLQREAMASAVRENSGERVLPGAGAAAAPAAEERAAAEWTGEASAGFC